MTCQKKLSFGDGQNQDGLFGGALGPLLVENEFTLGIGIKDNDMGSYYVFNENKHKRFTSIGPVIYSSYTITSTNDTIPNPGDYLKFRFNLKNMGSTAVARDISTKIICLDTCTSFSRNFQIYTSEKSFGDIAASEVAPSTSDQYIKFIDSCTDGHAVHFAMEIFSDGYHFWSDTFRIDVISGLKDENQSIIKEFKLHQNHPNPFISRNPV